MLKYQLKKGVKLEVGMAFRYKSNEELEALISALGLPNVISRDAITSSSSLKHSGLLIFSLESPSFSNENKLEKRFIIRKYLVGRDERIMKKKDFFDKTEYDNGIRNNKGSVSSPDPCPNNTEWTKKPFVAYAITNGCGFRVPLETCREGLYSKDDKDKSIVELLSLLRTKAVKDKQYEFAADIRDIESHINTSNSTVVRKGIVTGNFEGSTIDHSSVNENANSSFKTIEKVPVNRVQETLPKLKANEGAQGFFDMLHSIKTIVVDGIVSDGGAEKDPFADKLYIVGMETDRIKKLVASKFPLFKVTNIQNIGHPRLYVLVEAALGCNCTLTIQEEEVVGIDFDFKSDDNALVSTSVLKKLISSYFGFEKHRAKGVTTFECVTDINGESRILMTDSNGNKVAIL